MTKKSGQNGRKYECKTTKEYYQHATNGSQKTSGGSF